MVHGISYNRERNSCLCQLRWTERGVKKKPSEGRAPSREQHILTSKALLEKVFATPLTVRLHLKLTAAATGTRAWCGRAGCVHRGVTARGRLAVSHRGAWVGPGEPSIVILLVSSRLRYFSVGTVRPGGQTRYPLA